MARQELDGVMLLTIAKRYLATFGGGLAIAAFIALGTTWLGQSTIERLVQENANHRAATFADYLLANRERLDALVTGVARVPDIETRIRNAAALAQITGFSIFDQTGAEVFSTGAKGEAWMLRDRPGGVSQGRRLSHETLAREGYWQMASGAGDIPSIVMPLIEDGRPVAYLSAQIDTTAENIAFARTLSLASLQLLAILFVAAGLPALLYMRRKRRMDEADERIVFLHNHDSLTTLLNRRRMHEETDRILSTSRATRERMALWFIDVDGLGDINDSMGQACGDELLRAIAARLGEIAERGDLVARIGPDEFAILQRGVRAEENLHAFAHRITAAMSDPIELDGGRVVPGLSIGAAMTPEHGRSYTDLIKHAELAFLHQKAVRREEFTLFRPSMDTDSHRRRQMEQLLREALSGNGFELFYQPIVSGQSQELIGFEALIRMPDGEGGFVPPSVFIPIAEARGYIKDIGSWVIGEAARQAALWPEHLFVSVNLSAVQFHDGDLVEIVRRALAEAGIPGHRLGIEVVESLLLEQSDAILEQLRALKTLGVSVDMDDFGTGYSSLGYLWRFPFDKLKIDQSFMAAFDEGKTSIPQILETIIALAHNLGLKVTAEGIETQEQADLLRAFGCDQLQGFFFGRPVSATHVAGELLQSMSTRRSQPITVLQPASLSVQ